MLILYAEDDPDDLEVFCEALRAINSNVVCQPVTNGEEVFDFLNNTVVLPDLIVLDMNMPVMDGMDCLQKLKSHEEYKEIPTLVYTTSSQDEHKNEMKKLGAIDYIVKPNTYADLVKVLGNVIRTKLK